MLPVVEFAFAFLLLLALMRGTIVYGFVSFARQTIDLVAQESAKPAITATTPFSGDGTREVADYAGASQAHFDKAQSQALLQYLPVTATLTSTGPTTEFGRNGEAFTVTVSLTGLTSPGEASPTISLGTMSLSDVPPLPSN